MVKLFCVSLMVGCSRFFSDCVLDYVLWEWVSRWFQLLISVVVVSIEFGLCWLICMMGVVVVCLIFRQ